MKKLPLVSFIIVARNASRHLPAILSDLLAQDYPKGRMQIFLIDGCSQDKSRKIMQEFADAHPDLMVAILDNYGKILSSGWNVALAEAQGDIIIRVDAHSSIPPEFISKNVNNIIAGESIAGGPRISKTPEGIWQGLLSQAEISKFGSGIADYRNPGPSRYIDTLAHAAYKRIVFEKVGGYDERLVRHQDNEIHYRMKQAGFKFFFDPAIKSFYSPRPSLHSFLKQKYSNGLWIGLAISIQPYCFGVHHFIPAIFVGAVILLFILGIIWSWIPLALLSILYSLAAFVFTCEAMVKAPLVIKSFCIVLPPIFLLMHSTYGTGTVVGLIIGPFFKWKNRRYKLPRPIKPQEKVKPFVKN